jgi:hypothetical protein
MSVTNRLLKIVNPKSPERVKWDDEHMQCEHIGRDEQRSPVSRIYLCFYSSIGHRCMYRLCPLVKEGKK